MVRPSQFIYTYGAGSIYETSVGSRIIPEISEWKSRSGFNIFDWVGAQHEIMNSHFSISNHLQNAKVFELPRNPEVKDGSGNQLDSRDSIIDLYVFPQWMRCVELDTKHKGQSYIFRGELCPECNVESNTSVRFIRVCQNGHMDDVNWLNQVHGKDDCSSKYLEWKETSKAISGIEVICPKCKKKKNMREIYSSITPCTRKWAECHPGKTRDTSCEVESGASEYMYVTIKSAPQNRYPVVASFLAISPTDRSKERRMAMRCVDILTTYVNMGKDEGKLAQVMLVDFKSRAERNLLTPEHAKVYGTMMHDKKRDTKGWEARWDKIFSDICKFETERVKIGFSDQYAVALKEFNNLMYALRDRETIIDHDIFDVDYSGIFSVNLNKKIGLDVMPVTRVTVDSVQVGYKRTPKGSAYHCENNGSVISGHEDHQEKEVQIAEPKPFKMGETEWYPGIREKGEAIFISSSNLTLDSILATSDKEEFTKSIQDWAERYRQGLTTWSETETEERLGYIKYNELYVWWHSFAHRIIDSLAMDSGYSSSSIREMIYFDQNDKIGGCLLYAHTPSADGTLGGLVALANEKDFKKLLYNAREKVFECSNGPLCSEDTQDGVACYACMFLSETSCIHNNSSLDKRILHNW